MATSAQAFVSSSAVPIGGSGLTSQAAAETPKTSWAPGGHAVGLGSLASTGIAERSGAGGLHALNAAIASLSAFNGGATTAAADSVGKVNEWDEVLRYLRLLVAVQADGAPSWERVRGTVQQLRDHFSGAGAPQRGDSDTMLGADLHAVQQLRAARQVATLEAESRDESLRAALQQVRDVQRECEQLKFRLSLEREARQTESKRMAEHGEALHSELRRDESRLEGITREVDVLRDQVLRPGGLEPWQLDRIAALKREHAQARLSASRHSALVQDEHRKLKAAQEDLRNLHEEANLIPVMAA